MNFDRAKSIVRVATIAWVPLGMLGVIPAMFSAMLFDTPGSEQNLAVICVFLSIFSFPAVCGVSVLISWLALRAERFSSACGYAMLPLVNLTVAVAGFTWLSWVQK